MDVRVTDGALTRELRRRVLRPALAPGSPLPGDDVAGVVHVGAFGDDRAVLGACLVFPEACAWRPESPAWRLRSMAVAPDRRGTGAGRAVLAAAVQAATDAGGALLWCHARETAAGFYAREGWANRDDPPVVYDEPDTGLPHRDMYRPL